VREKEIFSKNVRLFFLGFFFKGEKRNTLFFSENKFFVVVVKLQIRGQETVLKNFSDSNINRVDDFF
jgi:hypothetical protein